MLMSLAVDHIMTVSQLSDKGMLKPYGWLLVPCTDIPLPSGSETCMKCGD